MIQISIIDDGDDRVVVTKQGEQIFSGHVREVIDSTTNDQWTKEVHRRFVVEAWQITKKEKK